MSSRIRRILSNLMFLIGKWLRENLDRIPTINELIEKFVDGWNHGCEIPAI